MKENQQEIYSLNAAPQTGCFHYHSPLDVVAIKFKCCQRYYPCYLCHEEGERHSIEKWSYKDFGKQVIMCRVCALEFTIFEYLTCSAVCKQCKSRFNPRCKEHWNIYFKEQALTLFQLEFGSLDQKNLRKE